MWHNFLVKTYHSNQYQRCSWLKKPVQSGQSHQWLINSGSLTQRLRQHYADFSVKLLSVAYAKPLFDEVAPLNMPAYKKALIREVLLQGNQHAVVFAHSVLPRASLRGRWLGLTRLGNRPLGASLFANKQVKRTALRYKKLSHQHPLYQHAIQHLNDQPAFLWARRSVFSLDCAHMLVTEVFLPELFK